MFISVKKVEETMIQLKPGDKVILDDCEGVNISDKLAFPYKVKRIVENKNGMYVVFNDGTWRPTSTYGVTWRKA